MQDLSFVMWTWSGCCPLSPPASRNAEADGALQRIFQIKHQATSNTRLSWLVSIQTAVPPLLPPLPVFIACNSTKFNFLPAGRSSRLPLTLFFQYLCPPPPASLPLGPVVLPLHDCTCIDLECTNSIMDRHSGNACVVWPELALLVFCFPQLHCRPAK